MTDGALTIKLDAYAARKLAEKAAATGLSPETILETMLGQQFFDYDDFTWINGDPRDDHTSNDGLKEEGRPWSEVRAEFVALIDKTFGKDG